MTDIDFFQIRIHDGSQDGGFEELICQLAHLSPPEGADYFVRKEGAGGDAGVECYWKLSDGSEHAWQAKYFLDALGNSQWTQINKSVITALEKHPELCTYYVCLPRDWTDSRKLGISGKPVTTAWDKWQEHVEAWEKLASDRGMKVEFCYWCKHEIGQMLQQDKAEFAGRAMYWFGVPVLTTDDFARLAERSRTTLGDRYTPEYHLDLPIANVLEALGESSAWWSQLEQHVEEWLDSRSKAEESVSVALGASGCKTGDIRVLIDNLVVDLTARIEDQSFVTFVPHFEQSLRDLLQQLESVQDAIRNLEELSDEQKNEHRRNLYRFISETNSFIRYLNGDACRAALTKKVLLVGEAGIGKSHLLCDISLSRIEKGLPTVFLLGQHYEGGDPVQSLKESLDLSGIGKEEFLGALDAAGEAADSYALVVIDAINEGMHREEWQHYLSAFISDIDRFPHIGVVLSCRTTYVEWLVPSGIRGQGVVQVTHYGFRGYEHRAASRYLSQQGIFKPSAPVTSPEFTNPLFLKTCCQAMRAQGMTAFPKGLHGITTLLDFYIDSVELIVSRQKHYRPPERIVRKSLAEFAGHLYPDSQFGIEFSEAVDLINGFDTRPNQGETLFDVLLHEGVLSEDIAFDETTERRDKVVIRFTYERFSDYLIALSQVDLLRDAPINQAFGEGGVFAPIVEAGSYFKYTGILAALCIVIAEKYGEEIIDLLPEAAADDDWLFEQVFLDTVQWRSPASFTPRTRKLLNTVTEHGFHLKRLDAILALSTEPGHPWNADSLHEKLCSLKMPERDAFWSTHVAVADSEEGDEEEESIERSIIEWAQSGVLEGVELDRLRLCVIVLVWMTSTSNRKMRDQATKSAARVVAHAPELLEPMLDMFSTVDDLYVLERIFAIAYGAVTNIGDAQTIKRVAAWVWRNQFASGRPIPHLLLRDYATGILEYAHHRYLLDPSVDLESFQPPFQSEWPLDDPTNEELNGLIGDEYSSSIRSSLMGFPGDFGNYTMGCVHQWSPTSISQGQPQTADELQREFAELLDANTRSRFIDFLEGKRRREAKPYDLSDLKIVLARASETRADEKESKSAEETEWDLLKAEIEGQLSPSETEQFRWVMGLGRSDLTGAFSRKKAQRWVCKRAIELGWSKDLFEDFERVHAGRGDRSSPILERVGKKYQWIAFHEYLAHLSDNCCYIDPGYSDVDYSKYFGPWQIHKRDLDPTLWMRSTGANGWQRWTDAVWWQPFAFPFTGFSQQELQSWIWDKSIIPPFERLLSVTDANEDSWLVLKGFSIWRKEPKEDADAVPSQDAWYRINSCFINKGDFDQVLEAVKGQNLCDPHILSVNSTGHQGFFREYPWHPVYRDMRGWDTDLGFRIDCKVENLVPIANYEWESGSTDHSLNDSISIYMPSGELISELGLVPSLESPGEWLGSDQRTVFLDPSVNKKGPSAALCRFGELFKWLEENDLQLIWLVGGEKQLFTRWANKFFGRLVYNGIYSLSAEGIEGEMWFEEQQATS